jgi:hypothetical protein
MRRRGRIVIPKSETDTARRLLVVMGCDYGERLREVSSGRPVWIILSPANEPIVRSIWTEHPQQDYRIGVTGLKFEPSRAAEDHFLVEIDTLDIHHGPYSTEKPYTELEVIGCHLTQPIRTELSELGFARFDEQATGFIAKRSREEAAIRRR